MLTEDERAEVLRELERSEGPGACCLEALRIVQRKRGFVPDEAIADIASLLGMTPDELDALATFYPFIFRRPVGRHVILICDGVTCWVMGYEQVLEHLRQRLGVGMGETTDDGMFTLLPVSCIGACDHAPAMIVDGTLYRDLDSEGIDEILEDYRQSPDLKE
jgi:NADH-quinone oxidoreductase subunit E